MTLLFAIVSIGFLILIHEAGHFLLARACGMKADVFSIGFGPSLLSWHGRRTEYRIALLPLGGYVRIAGMAPGDGTAPDDPASFANRPAWQRFLVILAGPFVNWLFAFLLLAALLVSGMEQPVSEPIVGAVAAGSPAASAGLQPGDRILQIDGVPLETWFQMTEQIRGHRGRAMPMVIERSGQRFEPTAAIGGNGTLGIRPSTQRVQYPVAEALPLAFRQTGQVVLGTLEAIGSLVRGRGGQVMGPVGIVSETVEAVKAGLTQLFQMLVLISMALAFMNILPLPALDGGRLVFIVIAMIRRRPVSPQAEAVVHAIGFLVLIGLLLFATMGDIGRQLRTRSAPPTQSPQTQSPQTQSPPTQAPEAQPAR